MKKIVFAMTLLIFLAAVSYASPALKGEPNYKHQTSFKGHHITHPVDHFTI